MVKGISKQVIVVHAPEPKLFEEAIFILREDAVGNEGITDELLLKEAKKLMGSGVRKKGKFFGWLWMLAGGLLTGLVWLATILL